MSQKKRRVSEKEKAEITHQNSSVPKDRSLQELLRLSKKIVVITGAGISANAGFPTFQEMRKSEHTSFDRSLYFSAEETGAFHSTICTMFEHLRSDSCQPTKFHNTLEELARSGQLLCHLTQNIDCMEQRLPNLEARTIRLHGQINQARCQKCNWVCETSRGMRALRLGELRPDVLLYGDTRHDVEIVKATEVRLVKSPDLVIVASTRLQVPAARSIAERFCRAGGTTIWISKENPSPKLRPLFDYILEDDCDVVVGNYIRVEALFPCMC
ncbi:DHS-like NAD/FAD-binding domain-containing protein [Halenospora varia]|nr:DHS-like NAD/FAD-binding domain-containing protein [Halenospora varia]